MSTIINAPAWKRRMLKFDSYLDHIFARFSVNLRIFCSFSILDVSITGEGGLSPLNLRCSVLYLQAVLARFVFSSPESQFIVYTVARIVHVSQTRSNRRIGYSLTGRANLSSAIFNLIFSLNNSLKAAIIRQSV